MKQSGLMWIRDEDSFIGAYFDASGDKFEVDHLDAAISHCKTKRTALDIGAHYGSWSRHMSHQFNKVIAFEPVAATFECCRKNLEGFDNVTLIKQVVGDRRGFATVGRGKIYAHPGTETVVNVHGDTAMIRVDDLHLSDLDLIKIDVEGFELHVLHGAEDTLRRCKPVVIFEENIRGPIEHNVQNGECALFLESLGARLLAVHNKDFIFGWPEPETLLPSRHATPQPYKVISFYTEFNEYAEHAQRLHESLQKFDVRHELYPLPLKGKWEEICSRKAAFIRTMWERSDVPIVWLDADATIEAPPSLFSTMQADFAIHRWNGWEFASGTLYFGKSLAVKALLDQWVLRCEADPMTWDQVHLQSAWCDVAAQGTLKTEWLPRSYCQIFDTTADASPVIKHWQASRTSQTKTQASLGHTPHGIELRKGAKPWRNKEAAFWISEGTQHIIPQVGHQFVEGNYVEGAIRRCVGGQWPMLEVGCGVGRIASLFKPYEYIGAELNPTALVRARRALPQHQLRIADEGYQLPQAPSVLIYTVLLHIPDDKLLVFLAECVAGRKRVILAEIMDRRWRRDGNPPVFNRDAEEYILLMQKLGFKFAAGEKHVYERYNTHPWNVDRDTRISFLCFDADHAKP